MVNLSDFTDDPDFLNIAKSSIEKEISNLKKVVDQVTQMRVQASLILLEMMTTIDAKTWEDISALIGLNKIDLTDVFDKKDSNECTNK